MVSAAHAACLLPTDLHAGKALQAALQVIKLASCVTFGNTDMFR